MNAYILDDEINARKALIDKISSHCPNVQIIGNSGSPEQALKEVRQLQPDLLFLDISMPEMNGFQFVENIPEFEGEIIFVTAYNQYALDAFQICAVGYLLKPIDTQALVNAIALCEKVVHAKTHNRQHRYSELVNIGKGKPYRLSVPTPDGFSFISLSEIIRLEADQKYTHIYSETRHLISSKNLGYFIDILCTHGFVVTHKSHIVNLEFVQKVDREGVIYLKNGDHVPLGRRRKKEFLQQFLT